MKLRHLLLLAVATALVAQPSSRPRRIMPHANSAEMAIKQAAEQLATEKKMFERDIEVLRRLRNADAALADAMQPATAIQKAYEEVDAAKSLGAEFLVMQGVSRTLHLLEEARRSPGAADFGRLRSILRDQALGPASRVAVRNALRLQEETLAWMRVQELISVHLRTISEITSESLRAAQQESRD
jgi:hypothetical protein